MSNINNNNTLENCLESFVKNINLSLLFHILNKYDILIRNCR